MDIVKHERSNGAKELHGEKVAAYWALFLLQNANPAPLDDGSFYLGQISNPAPKSWSKATPYSVARKETK